ncbi:unnamed protein product [Nezara viridula]|uniref:Uncharacterized protein n=1 Tax=Nezara viridula TaxID=85310 RepID=A0A9P0E6I6_NEZVI|nr:unnamed protein product [Nezara viridula]
MEENKMERSKEEEDLSLSFELTKKFWEKVEESAKQEEAGIIRKQIRMKSSTPGAGLPVRSRNSDGASVSTTSMIDEITQTTEENTTLEPEGCEDEADHEPRCGGPYTTLCEDCIDFMIECFECSLN